MKNISFVWNLIVSVSTIVLISLIPLALIFDLHVLPAYYTLNWLTTAVLILDIPMSILIYKNYEDDFSFEEKYNLSYYLRHWFIIDLLAAFPLGVIFSISYLPLIRFVKIFKILHFMSNWRSRFVQYAGLLRLLFFMIWAFILVHWISCIWIGLRGVALSISKFENYVDALYWSVTTLTTVGFGDITPQGNSQRLFAVLIMIIGVGFYGYLIGNIATILSKRDPARDGYLSNIDKLNALTLYRVIPKNLQKRLRDYYTYMWKQKLGYNEDNILEGLPDSLKSEVSLYLKKEVIDRIQLFKDAGDKFNKEIALLLKPIVVTPGDSIFHSGDEGEKMYFVVKGKLSVYNQNNEKIADLSEGDFFGEIALFMDIKRTATIIADSYCDLYFLNKKTFDYVVNKYSGIKEKIKEKAIARQK